MGRPKGGTVVLIMKFCFESQKCRNLHIEDIGGVKIINLVLKIRKTGCLRNRIKMEINKELFERKE